jgi:hypothetical protein
MPEANLSPTARNFEQTIVSRWGTSIGFACLTAIVQYVESKKKEWIKKALSDINQAVSDDKLCVINFSDFHFEFEKKQYDLILFAAYFKLYRSSCDADLRGVIFRNIEWGYIRFENCDFSQCLFDNSVLSSIEFNHCMLYDCVFRFSQLSDVELQDSVLSYARFDKGVIENLTGLNDTTLPVPFRFEKVSYLFLIRAVINEIWQLRRSFKEEDKEDKNVLILPEAPTKKTKNKHTIFKNNDLKDLQSRNTKAMREHIYWYQYVMVRLSTFKKYSRWDNFVFTVELIMTKLWTSVWALLGSILVINLIFGFVYSFFETPIPELLHHPLKALYFSVVTFATLGYGDIHPITRIGEVLVIIEVLFGYISLGMLVYLLSRIVDKKY